MKLEELVGEHKLSGVDYSENDDAQEILFILDNETYLAKEDPDDGYRSMCEEIEKVKKKVKNTFIPVDVICKMKPDGGEFQFEKNDVLEMYDAITNELVFAVGTGNTDDYYPYFVFEWNPENMILNEGEER